MKKIVEEGGNGRTEQPPPPSSFYAIVLATARQSAAALSSAPFASLRKDARYNNVCVAFIHSELGSAGRVQQLVLIVISAREKPKRLHERPRLASAPSLASFPSTTTRPPHLRAVLQRPFLSTVYLSCPNFLLLPFRVVPCQIMAT